MDLGWEMVHSTQQVDTGDTYALKALSDLAWVPRRRLSRYWGSGHEKKHESLWNPSWAESASHTTRQVMKASKRVAVSPLYHQIRCTVYRLYIYRTMFLKTGNAASVLGSGTWSICCGSKVKDLWWNRACRLVWWVRRMCSSCVTWTSRLRRFGRIYKYGPQCGQSHNRPPI